tara:strand:+ start:692 stop:973 length:282 start_codon:yes stop_codon:yes gene_type:complete
MPNDNPLERDGDSVKSRATRIAIWQPRYKDDVALIACHKVKINNDIVFTKAKHLAGLTFRITSKEIIQFPKESNGKINCYAVPMAFLRERSVA